MKLLIPSLCLAALVALPATARKKHEWTTVSKPAVAYSFKEVMQPVSVAFCDTCTRVTFDVNNPSWNIAATARLVAAGQSLPVRRGTALQKPLPRDNGQPLDTTTTAVPFEFGKNYYSLEALRYMEVSDDITPTIILEFPPLPKGTTTFDFDEGVSDNEGQFCVSGIRLDGQQYPAVLADKAAEATPFQWTASTSAEAREARVRVNIIGENLPAGMYLHPQFFPTDRNSITAASLTQPRWEPATDGSHGGTAVFTFAVPTLYYFYLANCNYDAYPVPCIPGEEVVLTIDYNTLHRAWAEGDGAAKFFTTTYADGRHFEVPRSQKEAQGFFTSDLALRAVNPDVAAQRVAERTAADALLARIGALEEVSQAEVDAIATPYRAAVASKWKEASVLRAKMLEGKGGHICEVPDVAPAEMIKTIVAGYRGKAVFVDLWATWCGPCCKGIEAMKPRHDDFSHDDVQFVYITDESSPADKWNAMVVDMPGDHYRLKSMSGLEPAVSGIPRYLIFDREGNLSDDRSGFSPSAVDQLCDAIRKAMGK